MKLKGGKQKFKWRKRCGSVGKIAYKTLQDARTAAREVNDRVVLAFAPLAVYRCGRCDCYHLGHASWKV